LYSPNSRITVQCVYTHRNNTGQKGRFISHVIYWLVQARLAQQQYQGIVYAATNTLLAQEIIQSNRFDCITKQRLNNILIHFNNFMEF